MASALTQAADVTKQDTFIPRPIHTRGTHTIPDVDDVVAIWLSYYGEHLYPGITQAGIRLYNDRDFSGKSADELELDGIHLFGIGGGWGDEHAFGGRPRKKGESCTSLHAKQFGVYDQKDLRLIIDYATSQNNTANSTDFDLGPTIKFAFRYCCGENADDPQKISDTFFHSFVFLNAIHKNEQSILENNAPTGNVPYSMNDIIVSWIKKNFGGRESFPVRSFTEKGGCSSRTVAFKLGVENQPQLRRILDYAARYCHTDNTWGPSNFELASLVRLAFIHNVATEGEIVEAAHLFLTAMWKKEYNFYGLCKHDWESAGTLHWFAQNRSYDYLQDNPNERLLECRITRGISNNLEFHKFCRSKSGGGAAIVIQRTTEGNTNIYFDKKHELDPCPILAEIRYRLRSRKNLPDNLAYEDLIAEGNSIEGTEEVYFDGHTILNGSPTAQLPPINLPLREIEEIVYNCVLDQMEKRIAYRNKPQRT